MHIIILGAGPAGLSAAIALSQLPQEPPTGAQQPPSSSSSSPSSSQQIKVTVLEVRPQLGTSLGGSVNLTPLAMRYLDRLGAGQRLRPLGIRVSGIELLSRRTGNLLGRLWADVDALRVRRLDLVASLLETAREPEHAKTIDLRFGVRVVTIREEEKGEEGEDESRGKVILTLDTGEEISGDVLLGCDGLHSVARSLYVEPGRKETYSGRAVAYGHMTLDEPGKLTLRRSDGQPGVVDTSLVQGETGSLVISFFEPTRSQVYMAGVMTIDEVAGDSRGGWKARGSDKEQVRQGILARFSGSRVQGLDEAIGKVEEWFLYPVYQLPPNGTWSKGRVLLLGDAAHAMPPQGESTGVAIEDGVLIAHLFRRRDNRSVSQILRDYEALRTKPINKLYKDSVWGWENAAGGTSGWFKGLVMEYLTIVVLALMNWRKEDHFARDVSLSKMPE